MADKENNDMDKRWWKNDLTILGVGVVVLLFIAVVGFLPEVGYLRYYVDGFTINRRAIQAPARSVLWETPAPLVGSLNDLRGNQAATIAADGNTIILSRLYSERNHELYVSRRVGGEWSRPEPLVELNSPYDEKSPELSRDGRLLFFHSNRPGGYGGYDLYVSLRRDGKWSPPVNLGESVNSKHDEVDASLSPDGMVLHFASNRPLVDDTPPGSYNLHRAYALIPEGLEPEEAITLIPKFTKPNPLDGINSEFDERKAVVNSRGDKLYFTSNRPGGYGGYDLYRSFVHGGHPMPPENLGDPVNSAGDEMAPCLTLEGYKLYFNSNRRSRSPNDFRFYEAMSREVLVRYDYSLLIALIIVVAAIIAVYFLMRLMLTNVDMSMVTKCLLLSLLLHLLFIALSSTWFISSKIGEMIEGRPDQITVSIQNLAREAVSMAIREGVASLPKVASSSAASRPAASVAIASQQPVRSSAATASTQANVVAAATSAVSPISMAEVETVTGGPSAASDSDLTAVAPMMPGDTGFSMETPRKTGDGDGQGEDDGSIAPGGGKLRPPQPEREQEDRPQPFEVASATTPMRIDPSTVSDAASAVVRQATEGTRAVDSMIRSFQEHDSSAGRDYRDPFAGSVTRLTDPGGVRGPSSSVGMMMFPSGITMERGSIGRSSVQRELGMLDRDPFRATAEELRVPHGRRLSTPWTAIEDNMLLDNQYGFDFFMPLFILRRLGWLRPVGGLIYSSTPILEIPVDTELEVPERYLEKR